VLRIDGDPLAEPARQARSEGLASLLGFASAERAFDTIRRVRRLLGSG
jgi:hypothetical protein